MDRPADIGGWASRGWEGSLSDRCRRAGGIGGAVALWGMRHLHEYRTRPAKVCWRCVQVTLGFVVVWSM